MLLGFIQDECQQGVHNLTRVGPSYRTMHNYSLLILSSPLGAGVGPLSFSFQVPYYLTNLVPFPAHITCLFLAFLAQSWC